MPKLRLPWYRPSYREHPAYSLYSKERARARVILNLVGLMVIVLIVAEIF